MPLYEYRCKQCGHVYEKIQSYSAPDGPCPRCAGEVERLLSAPSIQFKGSGFYLTDYGKTGAGAVKSGANADSGSSSPSEISKATPASNSEPGTNSPAASSSGTSSIKPSPSANSSPAPSSRSSR